jgi:riboflavin synthase
MFTGIVEDLGRVTGIEGPRLTVESAVAAGGAFVGASVAVNGVCLTVVEQGDEVLAFDLTEETLERTALGRLAPGDPVNL